MASRQSAQLSQLKARGLGPVLLRAGIKPAPFKGQPGWSYPTFTLAGEETPVRRWKNAESNGKPKYAWIYEGDPELPRYYALPGLSEAVAASEGVIWLAAGEPDVWAYLAAGVDATLCWYGEGNVPATLAADLTALGVTRAVYCPDLDEAGFKSALKVVDRLNESGIDLDLRRLPGQIEDRGDVNDLWIQCAFNAETFRQTVRELPGYPVTEFRVWFDQGAAPPPALAAHPALASDAGELEEVKRRVLAEIEKALVKRGKRPGYYNCPYGDHGPDGKDFLYDPATGMIGGCQGKHAGQLRRWRDLAEHLGIDVTQIARDVRAERVKVERVLQGHKAAPTARQTPSKRRRPMVHIVSSRESISAYRRILSGDDLPPYPPIPAPYKPLRRLGGLAGLWQPRKTIVTVSGAGMGKTSLIETTIDTLNMEGHDTIGWGVEWSPVEYLKRQIAGWGGPSFEAQSLHELWLSEQSLPFQERKGTPLPQKDLDKMESLMRTFESWPGQHHWVDQAGGSLAVLLKEAGQLVAELRDQGRKVSVFYLDYIQKAQRRADNWAELELILNDVWGFGVDKSLVTFINSQVNKGEGEKLRAGTALGLDSMQSISDQKMNVVLTLNPVFVDGGRAEQAVIRCLKNNAAAVPAEVKVKTALYRHRWVDHVYETDPMHRNGKVVEEPIPLDL